MFETDNMYRGLSFGITSLGLPFYVSSGLWSKIESNDYYNRNSFFTTIYSTGNGLYDQNHIGFLAGAKWSYHEGFTSTVTKQHVIGCCNNRGSSTTTGMCSWPLTYDPDYVRGSTPLHPSHLTVDGQLDSVGYESYIGHVDTVRMCNMKNYNTLDEVTFGNDTYVLFKSHPTIGDIGVAVLK